MEEHGKISFTKFWTLLERKHLNKQFLINNGIHRATIYKIARDETINTDTIARLCFLLKCKPQQILDYIPPEECKNE